MASPNGLNCGAVLRFAFLAIFFSFLNRPAAAHGTIRLGSRTIRLGSRSQRDNTSRTSSNETALDSQRDDTKWWFQRRRGANPNITTNHIDSYAGGSNSIVQTGDPIADALAANARKSANESIATSQEGSVSPNGTAIGNANANAQSSGDPWCPPLARFFGRDCTSSAEVYKEQGGLAVSNATDSTDSTTDAPSDVSSAETESSEAESLKKVEAKGTHENKGKRRKHSLLLGENREVLDRKTGSKLAGTLAQRVERLLGRSK